MVAGFLSSTDPAAEEDLRHLHERMNAFYARFDSSYWAAAEQRNANYHDGGHPFHLHLLSLLESSSGSIVDLGCGSAHLGRHLLNPGRYTGVDWAEAQMDHNRKRLPQTTFIASDLYATPLEAGTFDWVVSLFVLEHCVYPIRFLEEMARLVRPGGRLVILCPHFRPGRMNSIWNGFLPCSFRQKLSWRASWDVLPHLLDRWWFLSTRLQKWHRAGGPFLVYRDPRCLHDAWFSDSDAVYWTSEPEVRAWLESRTFVIEHDRTAVLPRATGLLYLVARKAA